jgi:hypothetical protein
MPTQHRHDLASEKPTQANVTDLFDDMVNMWAQHVSMSVSLVLEDRRHNPNISSLANDEVYRLGGFPCKLEVHCPEELFSRWSQLTDVEFWAEIKEFVSRDFMHDRWNNGV